MRIEIWEDNDDNSVTVIPEGDFEENKHLFTGTPKLLRTIEGVDWNDCMIQHHAKMGWEPYIPFD